MEDNSSKNKNEKKEKVTKEIKKKRKIIEEGSTCNADPISQRVEKKLYNSIFKISFRNNIGTGFLIKLNLRNKKNYF